MTRNSLFFLVGASSLSHFVSLRSFLFFSQFTECRLFKRLFLRTFVSDSFLLPARQGQHPHSSNRRIVCNRKSVEIDFVNLIFVVSFDSAFPLSPSVSVFVFFMLYESLQFSFTDQHSKSLLPGFRKRENLFGLVKRLPCFTLFCLSITKTQIDRYMCHIERDTHSCVVVGVNLFSHVNHSQSNPA